MPYDSTPEHVLENLLLGPETTWRVTEERSLVTKLPDASSTATSGCGVTGVPTVPLVGCWSHTSWVGWPTPLGDGGAEGS